VTVRAGDWIVRMDQPYTQMIRTMLAVQRYKPDDPSPYDDTGWTLDELRHVETYTISDSAILSKPMRPLTADATVAGRVVGTGATLLVRHIGDWRSAVFPWKAGGRVTVADTAFSVGDAKYPAGHVHRRGRTQGARKRPRPGARRERHRDRTHGA
jgi:hypothetical protein